MRHIILLCKVVKNDLVTLHNIKSKHCTLIKNLIVDSGAGRGRQPHSLSVGVLELCEPPRPHGHRRDGLAVATGDIRHHILGGNQSADAIVL